MPIPPSPAPFDITVGNETFHVREARYDELDNVGYVTGGAFVEDRLMNYIGGVNALTAPKSLETQEGMNIVWFYTFLLKTCHLSGGRVVIALSTSTSSSSESAPSSNGTVLPNGTNVAGAACWYPPGKSMKRRTYLKGGVIKVFKGWGRPGLKRAQIYTDITHKVFDETFASLSSEKKGTKYTQKEAWYLQVIFTSKVFEGRGIMSILMREGYTHAKALSSTNPFILEASSIRSRDRYAHLGFELTEPKTLIGIGIVNSKGLFPTPIPSSKSNSASKPKPNPRKTSTAEKENKVPEPSDSDPDSLVLEGVPVYCMVNWNPSVTVESATEGGS